MMELVHVVVFVLSLLSTGQSAPLSSCESLTQPLEIQGRDQLLGRWTYIGESTNIPGTKVLTNMFVETTTLNIVGGDSNDTVNIRQTQKVMGRCFSLSYNQTLKSNTISMEQPYTGSAILLNTNCPDCLVFYANYTLGQSTYRGLQLLSRRPKLSDAEMTEFTKQILCLRLPRPIILDPEKGFCSEESDSDGKTIDLSDSMKNMGTDQLSDQLSELDKLLNSRKGLKTLMEMITTAVEEIDPN